VAVGLGVIFNRYRQHSAAVLRLHDVTLPEIRGLIARQEIGAAFALAVQAERDVPDDPELAALWPRISVRTSIESAPAGAEVYVKEYRKPQSEWQHLGKTPLQKVRLPAVYSRWKVEVEGCAPLERASAIGAATHFVLDPADAVPSDMVRVAGSTPGETTTGFPAVNLGDFLIDRYEVTNRQFKEFVDHGGYANAVFWTMPFSRSGRLISREDALLQFHDSTGRPGPATWRKGTYPENTADLPVTGVSWFEAAAYAEFAGKRLPSIYHWRSASLVATDESVVPLSNFAGHGLAPAGTYQGMSACGAYDMAGNAKEWCANPAGPDVRYILGGSWREPDYMFAQKDALSPFDRSEANGFRCMKLIGSHPLPPEADAEYVPPFRDFTNERPIEDEAFRVIRSLYTYDKTPLDSSVEGTDDTDPRWRKEKVSFLAAYGAERVPAYLFLPKNSTPPYQTILYVPGSGAITAKTSENLHDMNVVAVMVASGRAVIYPVYKGTYERRIVNSQEGIANLGPAAVRDWYIMISKDLGRTIDYLETRSDLQAGKLAYMGNSWGAYLGAILPAVENRIKVNILMIGGFLASRPLPEIDQINFAPRNTVPTLMLNGRYDFRFPLETSQRPMFRWLGAPPEQKRQVLFDTGHALKPEQIASEAYSWLDRYLGLVK
jgi:dienelactone hydrolase